MTPNEQALKAAMQKVLDEKYPKKAAGGSGSGAGGGKAGAIGILSIFTIIAQILPLIEQIIQAWLAQSHVTPPTPAPTPPGGGGAVPAA